MSTFTIKTSIKDGEIVPQFSLSCDQGLDGNLKIVVNPDEFTKYRSFDNMVYERLRLTTLSVTDSVMAPVHNWLKNRKLQNQVSKQDLRMIDYAFSDSEILRWALQQSPDNTLYVHKEYNVINYEFLLVLFVYMTSQDQIIYKLKGG